MHRTKPTRTDNDAQACTARTPWGGPVDPFILARFDKYDGPDDPIASLVIFEWKDEDFIGVYPSLEASQVLRSNSAYIAGLADI